jgi:hypothetical protein
LTPTLGEDLDGFRRVRKEFDNRLALKSWVIEPGTIRISDPISLVPTTSTSRHVTSRHLGVPGLGADYPVSQGRAGLPPFLG